MFYIELKEEKAKIFSGLRTIEKGLPLHLYPKKFPGKQETPHLQEKTLNAMIGFLTIFNTQCFR